MAVPKRVAVIGGGAAGLATARWLRDPTAYVSDLPLSVTVFEQATDIGGTWTAAEVLDETAEQSALYNSLRTNLPKEIMSFSDYPFDDALPSFMHHTAVGDYLRSYSRLHGLEECIRLSTKVDAVVIEHGDTTSTNTVADTDIDTETHNDTKPNANANAGCGTGVYNDSAQWIVTSTSLESGETREEAFDVLVVANGHYAATNEPDIPGASVFPGSIIHSHEYREPSPYTGQTVVLIGKGASGVDISREIASVASAVYLSHKGYATSGNVGTAPHTTETQTTAATSTTPTTGAVAATAGSPHTTTTLPESVGVGVGVEDGAGGGGGGRVEVIEKPLVTQLSDDGGVVFADGSAIAADAVVYCTGYVYSFPFFDRGAAVLSRCTGAGGERRQGPHEQLQQPQQPQTPLLQQYESQGQRDRRRRRPCYIQIEGKRVKHLYKHTWGIPVDCDGGLCCGINQCCEHNEANDGHNESNDGHNESNDDHSESNETHGHVPTASEQHADNTGNVEPVASSVADADVSEPVVVDAPPLAFVGLNFKVVPGIVFELQAKWIAAVLSGSASLPCVPDMLHDEQRDVAWRAGFGLVPNHTHLLAEAQWGFYTELAGLAGVAPPERWREEIYDDARDGRRNSPHSYWGREYRVAEDGEWMVTD